MDVEVIDAGPALQPVLAQLCQLYQYDFTQYVDDDVDEDGRYRYEWLDAYFTEPERQPFLLRVDGHWAGMALVRAGAPSDMAEFFVMRKYRRHGVGTGFARELFARFPGEWTVRELAANAPAQAFWRRTIPVPFVEETWERGPMQRFTMPPA